MQQRINIDNFSLIIFGDYSVLTNTPFKDHQPLHMLSGREEYLAWLQEDRHQRGLPSLYYAVAANKGGAAWDKHTEDEGEAEVKWTAEQIGTDLYAVCFGCPTCAPGFERYTTLEMLARRKPAPVMFRELAEKAGVPFEKVLIVDHYSEGYKPAKELGATWQAPAHFFAHARASITTATTPLPGDEALLPPDVDLFDIDAALDALEEDC